MNWARALPVACTAGSLIISACSGNPGPGPAPVFSPDLAVSEQAPGIWERELPAGAYFVGAYFDGARESDLDFRMTLEVHGQRTTFADEIPRHGFQVTVVALREPARVRVEIHNADFRDWKGNSTLSIVRLRDADAPPDERELGFLSFGTGGMRLAQSSYAERELSVESFRDAVRHFTAANDIAARADANYALAFTEYLVRIENTVPIFEEAIRRAIAIGDTKERAKRISNLAWTHNRLGLFEKSTREYEEIVPLSDRQRDPRQYGYILGNYGLSAVAIGEFDSALAAQADAHAVFVEIGMRAEAANALSSIGGIYLRIGDPEVPFALTTSRSRTSRRRSSSRVSPAPREWRAPRPRLSVVIAKRSPICAEP